MQHDRIDRKRRALAKVISASHWEAEQLESRVLLSAVVATADPITHLDPTGSPMAPNPGHSFYVAGLDSSGVALSQYADASAITPYTTNDLVMNVATTATNYSPCCEGANGSIGRALLTNGLTQSQTAAAPNAGSPAVGDGGASDASSNTNTISSGVSGITSFTYTLGSAGGATPSANGYDLSEIDVITGHQDRRTGVFGVDILVQPVGGDQFLSLSGGAGFTLTGVPNGTGGIQPVLTGSLQMAIVNSSLGQAITQHIHAIQFQILDPTTFFRELVVTGTASGASLSPAPAVPTGLSSNLSAGYPTISWGAAARAVGYAVQRSTTVDGTYTSVGSVANDTSFVDTTALPNSTYFYEVVASGAGDSAPSAPSAAVVTGSFGATGYFYQAQLWQGTPAITEALPQIDYSGDNVTTSFPLQLGFIPDAFSTFVEGKITTDLAGSYTFTAPTDDDGYLWVNGQLVSEDPGFPVVSRPQTNTPITLAANTSYDFVFLLNNRRGSWNMKMNWQEPLTNGQPNVLTLVPANRLSIGVDAPPVPAAPTATAGTGSIQVNWSATGDVSSYAYVVERATADSNGNPTSAFTTVGQAFSGPTTVGAAGSAAWGATSFVDTTGQAHVAYVYRVGAILPSETTPATLSATSLPATPGSSGGSSTLSATLGGKLPAALVAGQKAIVNQTVTIVNSASTPVKGVVRADLFLASGTAVDLSSIHLGTVNQRVNLKSRKHAVLKFKLPTLPTSTASGSYHLVVQITDPTGKTFDIASAGVISVAAAQIDLSGAFAKAVVPGKNGKTPLTFTVKNTGNVAAVGLLTFNIAMTSDGSLANASTFATLTKKVNLKPGKPLKVSSTVKLPAGSYFVLIQIDPSNAFKDVDLTNNVIVSGSQVTAS